MAKSIKIYVEGGGDAKSLHAELRQGFQYFFKGWGLDGVLPRVVACGSRNEAFADFKTAIKKCKSDEMVLLLVDSEEHPIQSLKWAHVLQRDSWQKPDKAGEDHLYFMTVCMESWFLADKEALVAFYGKHFKENKLPSTIDLESLHKNTIYQSLKYATSDTQKGEYGKGAHSFKILSQLDSSKVINHGVYACELYKFLMCQLKNKCEQKCDEKVNL